MKTRLLFGIVALALLAGTSSCLKKEAPDETVPIDGMELLDVSDDFNFSTTKDVEIDITILNTDQSPLAFVPIELLQADYDLETEKYTNERVVFKAMTNQAGRIQSKVSIATAVDELIVGTDYLGLPHRTRVALSANQFTYVYDGKRTTTQKTASENNSANQSNYLTLGNWSTHGLPYYLVPGGDFISSGLLADINASLPEGTSLPVSHPMYFSNDLEFGIHLQDSADVWVTFVAEGAGWANSLGFYYYDENSPPQTVNDITNKTIIFPNVTYNGYGAYLLAGDKVYLGAFPAGTIIQWFLVAQGWNNAQNIVTNGSYIHYSESQFNIEPTASLRQHTTLLHDEARELLILSFEDVDRDDPFCDQDFNDAVFYATVNPIEAVITDNLPPIDTPVDSDNDGVNDPFDDYPNDPLRAYDIYAPSDDRFGTLAFEDLWPETGDYDFNDVVLDYQFKFVANAANQIVELFPKYVLKATGASFSNAFGIEFPISPNAISSVSGGVYTESLFTFAANGTEANQSNAVVIAFDNAHSVLSYPGTGLGVNTTPGAPYIQADTITQHIAFSSLLLLSEFGTAPFNPFIVANQLRGAEIHLKDNAPTDLANPALFGTYDDVSNVPNGSFYKTGNGLPWAINLPEAFDYPNEETPVNAAYLKFNDWAQSSGALFPEWYKDYQGYRNASNIY